MAHYMDEATGKWREAKPNEVPPNLNLFGEGTEAFVFDGYWIVYETAKPLSQKTRKQLKAADWKLQHHSRTNKEMWVYYED